MITITSQRKSIGHINMGHNDITQAANYPQCRKSLKEAMVNDPKPAKKEQDEEISRFADWVSTVLLLSKLAIVSIKIQTTSYIYITYLTCVHN